MTYEISWDFGENFTEKNFYGSMLDAPEGQSYIPRALRVPK